MRARDNPFRSDRVLAVRYRLHGLTWDGLLARFESLGRRAAIVGPKGSGKTTLLEDLAPRLRARGFAVHELRLDEEAPRFEPELLDRRYGGSDIVLLDGAEQLGRSSWAQFVRQTREAAGLLVTSHRPGLLPTLLETSTSPELLAGLVGEILGDSAGGLRSVADELHGRHGGNLREAFRELYDRYAAADA